MKNPNNYGTVYRMKGNRRRPFIAKVFLKKDKKGKRTYLTLGYYEEKPDAIIALAKYQKNKLGNRQNITLGDLFEEWKKDKYDKISKSTQNNYNAAWKRFKTLEDERMVDIKKSHLQTLTKGLNVSYSSIHKVKTLATLLWDYAMADDIVDRNYGAMMEIKKETKTNKAILNDLEIDKIDKLAKSGDEVAMTIMILIYTGLRIGELLILTKFNVNLKDNIITGGIKTDAGKDRVVPINIKILPYIKHWYNKPYDLLVSRNGDKVTTNYYRDYWWYETLGRAGIENAQERRLTPHSTRHTCATLLSRSGVSPLAIQRILGHAKYSTSADLYTKTDVEMLKEAIAKI